MPSTFRWPITSAAHAFTLLSLLTASALTQAEPVDEPRIEKRALTSVGCFSSAAPLTFSNTYEYQSSSWCSSHCTGSVFALTGGGTCFCGNELPAADTKVDDLLCNSPCNGFGAAMCGGIGFYTVYTTGTNVAAVSSSSSSAAPASSSSSSSSSNNKGNTASPTSSSAATVVTSEVSGGSTVVVTVQPTAATDADAATTHHASGGGGGSNTAGIAAGVVVGLVVLAGIVAGLFFFLKRRKQKQAEEDYKQRSQVADFMRGANERKPGTGYSGMSDSRLDPEAGRRNSVGSLADNEDYSRRILRVANPDSGH